MNQPRWQARLKPEHRWRQPQLGDAWYVVEPLWPGLTTRMTNLNGERLTRIRVNEEEHLIILAEQMEFRPVHSGVTAG